jgi:putative transposase
MALTIRPPGADATLIHHSDAGQHTSFDYNQELDDHQVLASIGSVGDACDNALAESFVDSFKTELIADRVWKTRAQLELAAVEYIGWFNHQWLHSALGDIPPVEREALHAALIAADSPDRSLAVLSSRSSDGLTTRRLAPAAARNPARGPEPAPPASSRPLPDIDEFRYAAPRH